MYLQNDVASMWDVAMQKLKLISQDSYDNWFSKVTPLAFNENNVWELGVSDEFFGDWLNNNFGSMLKEVLDDCQLNSNFKFVEGYAPKEVVRKKTTKKTSIDTTPLELFPDFAVDDLPITDEKIVADKSIIEKTQELSQQPILSSHTFSNFIVGEENREAFTAAKMVSEEPGLYNPLYIYGNTGTGKTHLLHAVANEAQKKNLRVRYATCEELLNDFLAMLQQKKDVYEFRSSVRDVDILLIDDVHLLSNKKKMQEEFFNMFNTLHMRGRQIILTSDKQPCEIEGLEERLVSRFELGMTTEIIPPDYEARLAILKLMRDDKKVNYKVSDQILEFIAQNISANVRRLKGAFIRVSGYCLLKKTTQITITIVEELLQAILSKEVASKTVSIDDIQKTVAEFFGLKINDILSNKRPKNIAEPRLIAMYLSRKHTSFSLIEIGQSFGKNHATILNAMKKVPEMCDSSEEIRRNVTQIESILKKR